MMNLKLLTTVFVTVFLAEIADKTQIATFLYASDAKNNKLVVFLGSSLALCLASAVAVFAGSSLNNWIHPRFLARLAGIAFILLGIWVFLRA